MNTADNAAYLKPITQKKINIPLLSFHRGFLPQQNKYQKAMNRDSHVL
jgi:hypothetical protein